MTKNYYIPFISDLLLVGIWETPIIYYSSFYLVLGVIGFALCYINKYFVAAAVPAIVGFGIYDFKSFERYNLEAADNFPFFVLLSIVFSILLTVLGGYINWRKNRKISND